MMEWLTIIALFLGPVLAVLVSRKLDKEREERRRKLDVFRMLMMSRRLTLSKDFVSALNLIEVEFHGEANVLDAWKDLRGVYNQPLPNPDNTNGQQLWKESIETHQTKLLSAIGLTINIGIEKLDLQKSGYSPMAWEFDDQEQREFRGRIIDLLAGRYPLPVVVMDQSVRQPDSGQVGGNGGAS